MPIRSLAPLALWTLFCGQALAESALNDVRKRIESGEFVSNVHSVIVEQDGQRLAEWYFKGTDEELGVPLGMVNFTAATQHDIRSVTKSVVSLLFGIARAEGAIPSLDTPVLDYFPEYTDLQTSERRKIRLRDLLDMTSGLHWDEQTYSYADIRNSERGMDAAADMDRYVISQPIDSEPGAKWRYSGGDVQLIASVIARATKTNLDAYASEKLFKPLGITAYEWLKNKDGVPFAASGLRVTPRDMAKIGALVLHQGKSDSGAQLVPAEWIVDSTSPHATAFSGGDCAVKYGYFWWLGPECALPWVAGLGNGGQRIWIAPSRNLLIVTTAGLYNQQDQGSIDKVIRAVVEALPQRSNSKRD